MKNTFFNLLSIIWKEDYNVDHFQGHLYLKLPSFNLMTSFWATTHTCVWACGAFFLQV